MDQWRELYVGLVQELLRRQEWRSPNGASEQSRRRLILWFYTPLPFYCLDRIPADLVVYDVMDELANFKNAAGDLRQREAKVLAAADVVFTGGRSLYQARRDRHPNVHLFPSGVEPEHFARALDPESDIAAEIAHLPRPILGYTGVIDERIDLELLRSLAVEHPEWSIVMVGPVAKIEATELPRLPNILYCGHQPYERLPNFLKGFDVCLMPFAINEATRSISPTKTLEYMAAHKPIVSTPVADVVANWGDVVAIAGNPAEFAAAIAAALDESESQRGQRRAREQAHLAPNTWDHIAAEMQTIIETSLAQPVAGRRACAEPGPESTLSPLREEASPVDF
jgi:glycosyltransferase involved in cell wall biosynthesis